MSQKITSATLLLETNGTVSSWNTLPLFGGSCLEEEVAHGDATERAKAERRHEPMCVRITVPKMPQAVHNTLFWLVAKSHVASVGTAAQYATRCGIKVLQRIKVLNDLQSAWEKAFLEGVEEAQLPFFNRSWHGFSKLSPEGRDAKVPVFSWVSGALREIAAVTGLPISTITLAAVVAGLSQSIEWVPDVYLYKFALAVRDFILYLERRVAALR